MAEMKDCEMQESNLEIHSLCLGR